MVGNHKLNILCGYEWKLKKGRLLSLNAKVSWMGGKRYLPMSMEHEGGDIMYDYTQAYSEHLPDYFRCDLNFNMKKNYRKFSLEWFVELNNITNHKNLWIKYYNANRGQEEKIYQYSFMPIGGCKLYFQSSRKK